MPQGVTTSGATVTPESPEHPQSRPASAPCWPMPPPPAPLNHSFPVPRIQMRHGLSSLLGTTACLNHSTHRDRLRAGTWGPVPGGHTMEPWVPKLTQGPVSQFCISFRLLWLGLQLLWNSGTSRRRQEAALTFPLLSLSLSIAQGHSPSFGTQNSSPHPLMEKMTKCSWCS